MNIVEVIEALLGAGYYVETSPGADIVYARSLPHGFPARLYKREDHTYSPRSVLRLINKAKARQL